MSRPYVRAAVAVAALVVAAGCVVAVRLVHPDPAESATPTAGASPTSEPSSPPTAPEPFNHDVVINGVDWSSWTLMDMTTGHMVGSANNATETNSTESMIKAWIAADFLADIAASGGQPTDAELADLRDMIHVSDNDAAERLYLARGGDAVIERLIDTCGLTDTTVYPYRWALTEMSSRDAARMGACLVNNNPAGPRWRDWLLDQMRHLDPSNAFGIPEALPDDDVAAKNGWTQHWDDSEWHLNCLGVWDHWSLAVMTRYPVELGEEIGAGVCQSVTGQLFPRS